MTPVQQTLVLIKPDGICKNLSGHVLNKIAENKFQLIACKMVKVSTELAQEHYRDLKDKPFFKDLVIYIQGKYHRVDSILALVYQGPGAIAGIRAIAGATNPEEADPTSIRGAFGRITTKGVFENVVHASSSEADAQREIQLWFAPTEVTAPIYPSKKVSAQGEVEVWA